MTTLEAAQSATCGVCGEDLHLVSTLTREGAQVTEWKHVKGAWHRPVVGTPVKDVEELWESLKVRHKVMLGVRDDKAPLPPPVQPARPAVRAEMPGGSVRILNLASKHGWAVAPAYAIGPWVSADGTTMVRLVESFILRLSRAGQRAVATWVTGADPLSPPAFESAYILTPTIRAVSSKELGAYLKEDADDEESRPMP